MITWHLEKRLIKDLIPHSKNPRVLTKDQAMHLQLSLERFGITDEPLLNTDNTIIAGHQRLRILALLGHEEVLCKLPERTLTAAEVDELNIRHNKNTGAWDWDVLANEWKEDDLIMWGFNPHEFGALAWDEELPQKQEDECQKCPECNQKLKKKKK